MSPIPAILAADLRLGEAVGLLCHQTVSPLSAYHVTGADAARFLQNRTSNDVLALNTGEGHLNTVLDKSGKIQGLFTLYKIPDDSFWLITETVGVEHTLAELLRFKILDEVTVTPSKQLGVSLHGASLHALLDIPNVTLALLPEHGIWQGTVHGIQATLIRHDALGEPAIMLWVPGDHLDTLLECLIQQANQHAIPLGKIDANTYHTLRIEAAYPIAGADYTTDTLLPETGLEQQAVSYDKGCYLGQETVARVRTYGRLPKALMGLASLSPIPTGELALADTPDKPIATVTSTAFSAYFNQHLALAYVGKTHREPGQTLALISTEGKPVSATVKPLPFLNRVGRNERSVAWLQKGLNHFANGNDETAQACLTQSIWLNPALADAYEALGAILGRHEQYEEAIELMHRLETLEPSRVMAQTNLSVYYMKLGDKETAEMHKAKATTLTFQQAMAQKKASHSTDSQAQKQEQDQEKAQEQAEAAARQQLEERAQLFREALQYSPDDPLGNFGLGSVLLELGDATGAIEALKKTVDLPTSQSAAYQKLGQAYEMVGSIEKAIKIYKSGVAMAATRRDLMPLNAMQARLDDLVAH